MHASSSFPVWVSTTYLVASDGLLCSQPICVCVHFCRDRHSYLSLSCKWLVLLVLLQLFYYVVVEHLSVRQVNPVVLNFLYIIFMLFLFVDFFVSYGDAWCNTITTRMQPYRYSGFNHLLMFVGRQQDYIFNQWARFQQQQRNCWMNLWST